MDVWYLPLEQVQGCGCLVPTFRTGTWDVDVWYLPLEQVHGCGCLVPTFRTGTGMWMSGTYL